jgi:hypothetical protein
VSERRPQEGERHPHAPEPSKGDSGTTGSDSEVKKQAGSYGRDAEQNPAASPETETEE